jgi:hypothetical protein
MLECGLDFKEIHCISSCGHRCRSLPRVPGTPQTSLRQNPAIYYHILPRVFPETPGDVLIKSGFGPHPVICISPVSTNSQRVRYARSCSSKYWRHTVAVFMQLQTFLFYAFILCMDAGLVLRSTPSLPFGVTRSLVYALIPQAVSNH